MVEDGESGWYIEGFGTKYVAENGTDFYTAVTDERKTEHKVTKKHLPSITTNFYGLPPVTTNPHDLPTVTIKSHGLPPITTNSDGVPQFTTNSNDSPPITTMSHHLPPIKGNKTRMASK